MEDAQSDGERSGTGRENEKKAKMTKKSKNNRKP